MHTGIMKAAISFLVLIAAWVDNNLSPLFWVLVGLACVDIFINARNVEAHYKKLLAMAVSLGLPAFLASHIASDLFTPEVLKVIVATLCLAYVQIVIPDLVRFLIKAFPKEAPIIQAAAPAIEQKIEQEAKAVEGK